MCKIEPVRRHTVDLSRALLVPPLRQAHPLRHPSRVRTAPRTPRETGERGGPDTLGLVEEDEAARLRGRPPVQGVPAAAPAGLVEAGVLVGGLGGVEGCVVGVAEDVLQEVVHAVDEVGVAVELGAVVVGDCDPAADFSLQIRKRKGVRNAHTLSFDNDDDDDDDNGLVGRDERTMQ